MKLTEWFPGDVKPVRRGVYERDYGGGIFGNLGFALWTGSQWKYRSTTPEKACVESIDSLNIRRPWRGLAEKP